MDVDDAADLLALLQHDLSGTRTGTWLRDSGVLKKLRPVSVSGAGLAANR
jgi:hypothetical protein